VCRLSVWSSQLAAIVYYSFKDWYLLANNSAIPFAILIFLSFHHFTLCTSCTIFILNKLRTKEQIQVHAYNTNILQEKKRRKKTKAITTNHRRFSSRKLILMLPFHIGRRLSRPMCAVHTQGCVFEIEIQLPPCNSFHRSPRNVSNCGLLLGRDATGRTVPFLSTSSLCYILAACRLDPPPTVRMLASPTLTSFLHLPFSFSKRLAVHNAINVKQTNGRPYSTVQAAFADRAYMIPHILLQPCLNYRPKYYKYYNEDIVFFPP